MNKKLGKDARLRLDGQRAAQFTELLAGEKQANAAILTLGREAFIKDGKLCRIEQGKYRKIF